MDVTIFSLWAVFLSIDENTKYFWYYFWFFSFFAIIFVKFRETESVIFRFSTGFVSNFNNWNVKNFGNYVTRKSGSYLFAGSTQIPIEVFLQSTIFLLFIKLIQQLVKYMYSWTSLYARDRDSKNRLAYNEFTYKNTKDDW